MGTKWLFLFSFLSHFKCCLPDWRLIVQSAGWASGKRPGAAGSTTTHTRSAGPGAGVVSNQGHWARRSLSLLSEYIRDRELGRLWPLKWVECFCRCRLRLWTSRTFHSYCAASVLNNSNSVLVRLAKVLQDKSSCVVLNSHLWVWSCSFGYSAFCVASWNVTSRSEKIICKAIHLQYAFYSDLIWLNFSCSTNQYINNILSKETPYLTIFICILTLECIYCKDILLSISLDF